MSSTILENKENVDVPNEFAKESKTTSTSSILKASQKENVLSEKQLTPQKPPKVSLRAAVKNSLPILSNFNLNRTSRG